jgi:hypothetical protein
MFFFKVIRAEALLTVIVQTSLPYATTGLTAIFFILTVIILAVYFALKISSNPRGLQSSVTIFVLYVLRHIILYVITESKYLKFENF